MKYVALVLTAILACASPVLAKETASTEIQVTGSGSVSMIPDSAVVNATIETNAASSEDALSRNNAIYESVVRNVTAAGVARSDIALSNFNINYNPKPAVLPPPEQRGQYGFTVSRMFAVRVRDVAHAGKIVDALTKSGITQLGGVQFVVSDEKSARAKALTMAMEDARAQAESLAQGAHVHIVGIKSIEYGGGGSGGPRPFAMAAMKAVPTNLDPGSEAISTNVSVTYLATP